MHRGLWEHQNITGENKNLGNEGIMGEKYNCEGNSSLCKENRIVGKTRGLGRKKNYGEDKGSWEK